MLITLFQFINHLNSTIPAVYREENNVLRYPGDDPSLGIHSSNSTVNNIGGGNSNGSGNGMISCPDFELPSMVTSDDFWESALRRERSAYENILSTLHAKEVVLIGSSSSTSSSSSGSSSNRNGDNSNNSNRAITRHGVGFDETGRDGNSDDINSNAGRKKLKDGEGEGEWVREETNRSYTEQEVSMQSKQYSPIHFSLFTTISSRIFSSH